MGIPRWARFSGRLTETVDMAGAFFARGPGKAVKVVKPVPVTSAFAAFATFSSQLQKNVVVV